MNIVIKMFEKCSLMESGELFFIIVVVVIFFYYYLNITFVCFIVKSCPSAKVYAVIWTTTPWTLPVNQAICFASNIECVLFQVYS